MAIIPDVPGLDVHILVNGQALPEYTDEDEDTVPNEVTKYVESQVGSTFSIQWKFGNDFLYVSDKAISCLICVDGKEITSSSSTRKERRVRPYSTVSHVIYKKGRVWEKSELEFADIVISEEEASEIDPDSIKNLGTISLSFIRSVRKRGDRTIGKGKKETLDMQPDLGYAELSEEKLKGHSLSHQAKLGKTGNVRRMRRRKYVEYPFGKEPFAKFHFKYRSRASLQSLCLIPLDPTPLSLEDKPIDELTPDELRELVKRQRSSKIKKEPKRETEDDDDGDEVVFVQERPLKAPKVTTNSHTGVEAVNLCDD